MDEERITPKMRIDMVINFISIAMNSSIMLPGEKESLMAIGLILGAEIDDFFVEGLQELQEEE